MKIAIVGTGLVGRLLAFEAIKKNWNITLFDQDTIENKKSCGYVAAGMLAPWCEITHSESVIFDLGFRSMSLWPEILKPFGQTIFWQQKGTIVLTHAQDRNELDHFVKILKKRVNDNTEAISFINQDELKNLEPELRKYFQSGVYVKHEGHICTDDFFEATTKQLLAKDLTWHQNTFVEEVHPFEVVTKHHNYKFDLVFDCRGLGAKTKLNDLRGVRGELIHLHAPEVTLNHPIRLLHPRYTIYVVPRRNHHYVVGATAIESEDMSPISVQSMMELLSTAYSLHSGFAEARIVSTRVQCRPALPDNNPKVLVEEGLVQINGLFRHGYLIAPALIQDAMEKLYDQNIC